jgi:hypothetical protein
MQKQLLFLFLIMLIPFLSFSQLIKKWKVEWDKEIEIITISDDTIKGLIATDLYELGNGRYFEYKTATKSKKENILNREINKIIYENKEHFRKTLADMANTTGYLKLQYEHDNIRYYNDFAIVTLNHSSIPNSNGVRHHMQQKQEIEYHFIEMDGRMIKVRKNKNKFLKQMKQLFGDCPEVTKNLKDKEYQYVYATKYFVETYCNWLEKQDK